MGQGTLVTFGPWWAKTVWRLCILTSHTRRW